MNGPGLERPKMPKGLKYTMNALLVVGTFTFITTVNLSTPSPTPAFRAGEVVAFKSDLSLKGTVDSVYCRRGDSRCTYNVMFAPHTGKWALVTRRLEEHVLTRTQPEK